MQRSTNHIPGLWRALGALGLAGSVAIAAACGSSSSSGDAVPPEAGPDAPLTEGGPSDAGSSLDADAAASDASDAAPRPCTVEAGACAADEYCAATDCVSGTCEKKPAEKDTYAPVCGCDGVTYWNTTVAAAASTSTRSQGECTGPGTKTCGGIIGRACPAARFCSYEQADKSLCNAVDLSGTCWGLPTACPMILIGPTTRACNAPTCAGRCDLIRAQQTFYTDNTCPQ